MKLTLYNKQWHSCDLVLGLGLANQFSCVLGTSDFGLKRVEELILAWHPEAEDSIQIAEVRFGTKMVQHRFQQYRLDGLVLPRELSTNASPISL